MRKYYCVSVPTIKGLKSHSRWWKNARKRGDIPQALGALLRGQVYEANIFWEDLQWCKSVSGWDDCDLWPLTIRRIF